MRRILPLLLAIGLSAPAIAATLTPERRAVPMSGLAAAAGQDVLCCVASNGDGFVAVWHDERSGHYAEGRRGNDAVYGTHLNADGTASPATGIQYFATSLVGLSSIASDGSRYVVSAAFGDGIYARRLDRDGQPVGDPNFIRSIIPGLPVSILASNGNGYILATAGEDISPTWIRLDANGRAAGPVHTVDDENFSPTGSPILLTTSDGSYHLLLRTHEGIYAGPAFDVTIDDHDNATVRGLPVSVAAWWSAVAVGNHIALTWQSAESATSVTLSEQILDAADQPIGPVHTVVMPGVDTAPPTIAYDGTELLIAQPVGHDTLYGARLTASGDPIDSQPFVIAGNVRLLETASGSGKAALVWWSNRDIDARVVGSFDELVSSPAAPARISNAPAVQESPVTAFLGGRRLTVWREGDVNGSIKASFDGGSAITIAPEDATVQKEPDVAVAGDIAMIAWRSEASASTQLRILGARLRADGTVLDPTPIVIADGALPASIQDGVSIATDGHSFIVVWAGSSGIEAKRVSPAGAVLDPSPLTVGSTNDHVATCPRALWTGSEFVFVYVTGASITTSGLSGSPVLLYQGAANWIPYRNGISASASGSRVVVAWADQTNQIQTLEFSANAPAPQTPRAIAAAAPSSRVSVASRGGAFLVAWSSPVDLTPQEQVQAIILDQTAAFLVAPADAYDVNVMPTPAGFTFTYARTDPDATNVAQLFTRDLVITRQRGVRSP